MARIQNKEDVTVTERLIQEGERLRKKKRIIKNKWRGSEMRVILISSEFRDNRERKSKITQQCAYL